jgi:hypothetical protein
VVLDRRLLRVSILHPEDGFIRSFDLPEGAVYYPLGGWLFQTGLLLIEDLGSEDSEVQTDGFHRTPSPLRSCDLAGNPGTDFGVFPGAERVSVTRQSNHGLATVLMSVPFGKAPKVAVGGSRLFFGSQDAFEIEVYGADGTLETLVRLDRPLVPVTDRDLEAFISREVGRMADQNEARQRRIDLEKMPRIEHRPAHGSLSADAAGYLFVEDYAMPGDTRKGVMVFGPDGKLTGEFEIPADLQILEVGSDYLLVRYEDELEVEYVGLYRLTRPTV